MQIEVIPQGAGVLIEATLLDASGSPLADKPLNFYGSNDGINWTLLSTVNTNDAGAASCSTELYNWYRVEFPGDETYEPAYAVVQFIPSQSPPPSPSPSPKCCSFLDFGCWFCRPNRCVSIFKASIDSIDLSIIIMFLAFVALG